MGDTFSYNRNFPVLISFKLFELFPLCCLYLVFDCEYVCSLTPNM